MLKEEILEVISLLKMKLKKVKTLRSNVENIYFDILYINFEEYKKQEKLKHKPKERGENVLNILPLILTDKYKEQIDHLEKEEYNNLLSEEGKPIFNKHIKKINKFKYDRLNIIIKVLRDNGFKVEQKDSLTKNSYLILTDKNKNAYKIRFSDHESISFNREREIQKLFLDKDNILNIDFKKNIKKNLEQIKDFFKENKIDIYY
jgi:hypothetical protein